jgi:hypothetical protein
VDSNNTAAAARTRMGSLLCRSERNGWVTLWFERQSSLSTLGPVPAYQNPGRQLHAAGCQGLSQRFGKIVRYGRNGGSERRRHGREGGRRGYEYRCSAASDRARTISGLVPAPALVRPCNDNLQRHAPRRCLRLPGPSVLKPSQSSSTSIAPRGRANDARPYTVKRIPSRNWNSKRTDASLQQI